MTDTTELDRRRREKAARAAAEHRARLANNNRPDARAVKDALFQLLAIDSAKRNHKGGCRRLVAALVVEGYAEGHATEVVTGMLRRFGDQC